MVAWCVSTASPSRCFDTCRSNRYRRRSTRSIRSSSTATTGSGRAASSVGLTVLRPGERQVPELATRCGRLAQPRQQRSLEHRANAGRTDLGGYPGRPRPHAADGSGFDQVNPAADGDPGTVVRPDPRVAGWARRAFVDRCKERPLRARTGWHDPPRCRWTPPSRATSAWCGVSMAERTKCAWRSRAGCWWWAPMAWPATGESAAGAHAHPGQRARQPEALVAGQPRRRVAGSGAWAAAAYRRPSRCCREACPATARGSCSGIARADCGSPSTSPASVTCRPTGMASPALPTCRTTRPACRTRRHCRYCLIAVARYGWAGTTAGWIGSILRTGEVTHVVKGLQRQPELDGGGPARPAVDHRSGQAAIATTTASCSAWGAIAPMRSGPLPWLPVRMGGSTWRPGAMACLRSIPTRWRRRRCCRQRQRTTLRFPTS